VRGRQADRLGNLYATKQRPQQKIPAAMVRLTVVGRAVLEDTTAFLHKPAFG